MLCILSHGNSGVKDVKRFDHFHAMSAEDKRVAGAKVHEELRDSSVIFGADGEGVNIKAQVLEILGNSTSLEDKPKLVFIQACDGGKILKIFDNKPSYANLHFLYD